MCYSHNCRRPVEIIIFGSQLILVITLLLLNIWTVGLLGLTTLCFHGAHLICCHPSYLASAGLVLVDVLQLVANILVIVNLYPRYQYNNHSISMYDRVNPIHGKTALAFLYPYCILLVVSLIHSILSIARKFVQSFPSNSRKPKNEFKKRAPITRAGEIYGKRKNHKSGENLLQLEIRSPSISKSNRQRQNSLTVIAIEPSDHETSPRSTSTSPLWPNAVSPPRETHDRNTSQSFESKSPLRNHLEKRSRIWDMPCYCCHHCSSMKCYHSPLDHDSSLDDGDISCLVQIAPATPLQIQVLESGTVGINDTRLEQTTYATPNDQAVDQIGTRGWDQSISLLGSSCPLVQRQIHPPLHSPSVLPMTSHLDSIKNRNLNLKLERCVNVEIVETNHIENQSMVPLERNEIPDFSNPHDKILWDKSMGYEMFQFKSQSKILSDDSACVTPVPQRSSALSYDCGEARTQQNCNSSKNHQVISDIPFQVQSPLGVEGNRLLMRNHCFNPINIPSLISTPIVHSFPIRQYPQVQSSQYRHMRFKNQRRRSVRIHLLNRKIKLYHQSEIQNRKNSTPHSNDENSDRRSEIIDCKINTPIANTIEHYEEQSISNIQKSSGCSEMDRSSKSNGDIDERESIAKNEVSPIDAGTRSSTRRSEIPSKEIRVRSLSLCIQRPKRIQLRQVKSAGYRSSLRSMVQNSDEVNIIVYVDQSKQEDYKQDNDDLRNNNSREIICLEKSLTSEINRNHVTHIVATDSQLKKNQSNKFEVSRTSETQISSCENISIFGEEGRQNTTTSEFTTTSDSEFNIIH